MVPLLLWYKGTTKSDDELQIFIIGMYEKVSVQLHNHVQVKQSDAPQNLMLHICDKNTRLGITCMSSSYIFAQNNTTRKLDWLHVNFILWIT